MSPSCPVELMLAERVLLPVYKYREGRRGRAGVRKGEGTDLGTGLAAESFLKPDTAAAQRRRLAVHRNRCCGCRRPRLELLSRPRNVRRNAASACTLERRVSTGVSYAGLRHEVADGGTPWRFFGDVGAGDPFMLGRIDDAEGCEAERADDGSRGLAPPGC